METKRSTPLPDFGESVLAVEIKKPKEKVEKSLSEWIFKQGWRWSKTLTATALMKDIEVRYAPYWLVEGSARGSWSGEVSKETQSSETSTSSCSSCNGSGQRLNPTGGYMEACYSCGGRGYTSNTSTTTVTTWDAGEGNIRTNLNVIFPNVAPSSGTLILNTPQIKKKNLVSPNPDIPVLLVGGYTADDKLIAKTNGVREGLIEEVKRKKSNVRNVSMQAMETDKASIGSFLYPLYVINYEYEGQTLDIQIDAVTGKVDGDIAPSILKKRKLDSNIVQGIMWAIVAILVVLTFKPFGLGEGIPTCTSPQTACFHPDTYYPTVMILIFVSLIAGWISKRVIGHLTLVKRVIAGLIVAVPIIIIGSQLLLNDYTVFQRIVLVVILFTSAATLNYSVAAFLFFIAFWCAFSIKIPDVISLPMLGLVALSLLLPEMIRIDNG